MRNAALISDGGTDVPVQRPDHFKASPAAGQEVAVKQERGVGNIGESETIARLKRELALKEAELQQVRSDSQRAFTLIRALPRLVLIMNGQGSIHYCGPQSPESLSIPREILVAKSIFDIIVVEDRVSLERIFAEFRAAQRPNIQCRLRFVGGNGTEFVFDCRLANELTNPRFRGVILAGTDVTAGQQEIAQVIRERDKARRSLQRRQRMLSIIGHEVRTPVGGIIGTLKMLDLSDVAQESVDQIGTAISAGENLAKLIDHLLMLARSENPADLPFDTQLITPLGLVTEVVNLYKASAATKHVVLHIRSATNIPNHISSDPVRLRQVLSNLIANAIKFTRAGRVTVSITRMQGADKPSPNGKPYDGVLCFEVADTGVGIDTKETSKLFQPFTQANPSVHRLFGGMGLGLAICKSIVTNLGGEIGVRSKLGLGSVFWFTLPYSESADSKPKQVERSHPENSIGPVAMQPLRVLLVDDNPVNQRIARGMLERYGHRVSIATNGQLAIEAVKEGCFDIVLMDVYMPDLDGIEATKAIRQLRDRALADIPILGLTADTDPKVIERLHTVGMNNVVTKPIDPDRLLAALLQLTGQDEAVGAPVISGDTDPMPEVYGRADTSQPSIPDNVAVARTQTQDGSAMTHAPAASQSLPRAAGTHRVTIDERALTTLRANLGESRMESLFDDFDRYSRYSLSVLRKALDRDDFAAGARAAHDLKGMAGSLGVSELFDLALVVETHCRAGQREQVVAAFDPLQELFIAAVQALRTVFQDIQSTRQGGALGSSG